MKRLATYVLAVAGMATWLAAVAAPVAAQSKPMLVVSLSGVDEIVGDVKYIMELSGNAPLASIVELSVTSFAQGVDAKRPVGVIVSENNGAIQPLGMLPVTDLDALMQSISQQVGPPRDAGDGVQEISGPTSVYVKESNGWAYVADSKANLESLPADPVKLLGGLEKKYDIAIRGIVKNIPQMYKDQLLQQMEAGFAGQLDNAATAEERELQQKLMNAQIAQWKTLMSEVDEFTLGIRVDSSEENAVIDILQTALPNTKTARQLASLQNTQSDFTGFHKDGAAFNMHIVTEMAEEDIETTLNMLEPAKAQALKEIAEDDDIPNEDARKLATSMVEKLFALIEETIRAGKIDGGASLVLENQELTFLSGMRVADGKKVQDTLDELIELASQEKDFPGVNKNADKIGDVNLHTMDIPVPANEEQARQVFGDTLNVVMGVGSDDIYMAFGKNCVAQLKSAIQTSQSNAGTVTPMHINVAVGPILEFASNFDDNPMVAGLAQAFKQHAGNDSIVITGQAIQNGAAYRLEIQSGILKSIGTLTGQEAGAAAGGGF